MPKPAVISPPSDETYINQPDPSFLRLPNWILESLVEQEKDAARPVTTEETVGNLIGGMIPVKGEDMSALDVKGTLARAFVASAANDAAEKWKEAGWGTLGVLGMLPVLGGIADVAKGANTALDLSKTARAARLARSNKMGYLPEVYYHGTGQVVEDYLDASKAKWRTTNSVDSTLGNFFTSSPEIASEYATLSAESMNPLEYWPRDPAIGEKLLPFVAKALNKDVNELKGGMGDIWEVLNKIVRENKRGPGYNELRTSLGIIPSQPNIIPVRVRGPLAEIDYNGPWSQWRIRDLAREYGPQGYTGLKLKNISDSLTDFKRGGRNTTVLMFNPEAPLNTKSIFAKFENESPDLLASLSGLTLAGALAQERE